MATEAGRHGRPQGLLKLATALLARAAGRE